MSSKWIKGGEITKTPYGILYMALRTDTGDLVTAEELDNELKVSDNELDQIKALVQNPKLSGSSNVVQHLDYAEDNGKVTIYREYCSSSLEVMLKTYGPLGEDLIAAFTRSILKGIEQAHDAGVGKAWVTVDSILVPHNGDCKVLLPLPISGFPKHSLPIPQRIMDSTDEARVDIWLLGLILLQIKVDHSNWIKLFTDTKDQSLVDLTKIEAKYLPEGMSEPCWDFIQKCLNGTTKTGEPTVATFLEHPFLNNPDQDKKELETLSDAVDAPIQTQVEATNPQSVPVCDDKSMSGEHIQVTLMDLPVPKKMDRKHGCEIPFTKGFIQNQ